MFTPEPWVSISKPHLMKVVNDLSQKGYLHTVRGRNGGIRLMREPRHINFGQVVRDTEDQLDVIGCLNIDRVTNGKKPRATIADLLPLEVSNG